MRAQAFSKRIDAQHYIQFFVNEIAHYNAERVRKIEERDLLGKVCKTQEDASAKYQKDIEVFNKSVMPHLVAEIQKLA